MLVLVLWGGDMGSLVILLGDKWGGLLLIVLPLSS